MEVLPETAVQAKLRHFGNRCFRRGRGRGERQCQERDRTSHPENSCVGTPEHLRFCREIVAELDRVLNQFAPSAKAGLLTPLHLFSRTASHTCRPFTFPPPLPVPGPARCWSATP